MERVTLAMQPFLYVRLGDRRLRWLSLEVPKIEVTSADGTRRISWGEDEEVWCNFLDEHTGERLRRRLKDKDWSTT